jgi:hypothetical protein
MLDPRHRNAVPRWLQVLASIRNRRKLNARNLADGHAEKRDIRKGVALGAD